MDNIQELKSDFKNGAIPKPEYIDTMYQNHIKLFEYADFIKDTNIKVSEMPVNRIYLWDEKNQVFVEKSHSPPFFSG